MRKLLLKCKSNRFKLLCWLMILGSGICVITDVPLGYYIAGIVWIWLLRCWMAGK